MMELCQIRRAIGVSVDYLAKGYVRHFFLEWALVPQTMWVWLSRGREFVEVRKALSQAAYVRI